MAGKAGRIALEEPDMNIEDLTPNQLARLREAGQCVEYGPARFQLSDQELLDLIKMPLSNRRHARYPPPDRQRVILRARPCWDTRR